MDDARKRTWAEIDLDRLAHNYRALRALTDPSCRFMGVVKANAYGHGAVAVARELEARPDLLIAVHPTRGLDIGATRYVHDTMIEARDSGCAVLLISADFDEILEMSDRILVMFEGQIMGEYSGKNPPIEEISLAMAGK